MEPRCTCGSKNLIGFGIGASALKCEDCGHAFSRPVPAKDYEARMGRRAQLRQMSDARLQRLALSLNPDCYRIGRGGISREDAMELICDWEGYER